MKNDYKQYAQSLNANSKVMHWIGHNLANYLKANPANPEDQDQIEHIIDYLISDEAPHLMEKMSYEEANKNAEKWTKKLIKKGQHIKEVSSDTQVILDFKDGFKIVKLIGKNAYEREGYLMRHCVASYFGSGKEIYSLRDADNMPHCTMEKDQQIKGKGNGNIHPKYIRYVVAFLEYIGMTVGDSEMLHLGYINVSKFKKYLSTDTIYFNDKYVPDNEVLLDKEGKEFAFLELLDVKPLIKETFDGEVKINFNLEQFIKLSINFLFTFSKKKDTAIQVSKGNSAQIGSSGEYAQIGSSGNSAQIGSSGYSAKIGSSGNSAQIGSSGDYAQIGSSGYSAQIGSSGYSAKIGSSGEYAQIGSSGNSAQIGSSGDYAKIGSSGYSAKIGSSGYSAKIGSSGNSAQIEIDGQYGVGANIGLDGKIKGKIGNWITLAEYDENYKPICVKSAQIDGKEIKEDVWYILKKGVFTDVE